MIFFNLDFNTLHFSEWPFLYKKLYSFFNIFLKTLVTASEILFLSASKSFVLQ